MRDIVAVELLSLDGVMQAPGRPDEDPRDGFQHGGWALPYRDPVMGKVMAGGMSGGSSLLFGRRTYQDFFRVWPGRKDNPFSDVLDRAEKYVASKTLTEPLPWKNSTLLRGDAADTVARLKSQPGPGIVILGSGNLVGSLIQHGLVDEFVLSIHPLMLGPGRRLFPDDGGYAKLRLVEATPTTTGVVIVRYRREAAS